MPLKSRLQVTHSHRNFKLVLFKSLGTVSYSPYIVALSCIVCEIIFIATYWSKIAKFVYPASIYRPRKGWPSRNLVKVFDADKTRMIGLPYGEKNYDNKLSRFHLIPQLDGRTELLYQYADAR